MNALSPINTSTAKVAPFKVGNFQKGDTRMELAREWSRRSPDEKFLSLSDLFDSVKARRDSSRETVLDTRKIEILAPVPKTKADTNLLSVGLPDGTELGATHWSFNQLCSLGKAPAGWLRTLPSQNVADDLTYSLRYNRTGETIKSYSAGDELRAVTGVDYGRIFDAEVVEAIQIIAGNGTGDERWKVPGVLDWRTHHYDPEAPVTLDTTTLFASDRDVFVFLVDDRNPIEIGKLPDGSPDLVFRGFYVTNSEVGSGALKIACFYLRGICCNRIMWGVEGFEEIRMVHSKYAPARFLEQARPALASFANGSEKKLLDGVRAAKEAQVAKDEDEALAFLQSRDFSKKKALEILEQGEREEGVPVRSAWDFAQALTANARDIPNNDDRVAQEMAARKILDKVA